MISFFVAGTPRPKGSHQAFVVAGKGGKPRAVVRGMGKDEKDWRSSVALCARAAMMSANEKVIDGPLCVVLEFYRQRPKSHFGKHGFKLGAPTRPTGPPDADKLMRSVGDALNGVCWRDDSQIVEARIRKLYCDSAQPFMGVRITVEPLE